MMPADQSGDRVSSNGRPLRRVAIAVMAKAPIAGVAKTRLGQVLGYAAAATLYRAFLLDTLAMLDRAFGPGCGAVHGCARFLVCPDRQHATLLGEFVDSSWPPIAQRRPGLLGGIADAVDDGFTGGADIVVVSDADSPTLPYQHVTDCVRLASERDVALGPTRDGGYYLIAVARSAWDRLPDLLLGTTYDSATICAATLERARQLGLTTGVGPTGFDVDTIEDLRQLLADLPNRPSNYLGNTRAAIEPLDDVLLVRDSG